MIAILITAGWVVLTLALLASIWWIVRRDERREGAHERGWTVEELRAIAGAGPLSPVLSAVAERLPFEEEYAAPERARDQARREWDSLMSWWEKRQGASS